MKAKEYLEAGYKIVPLKPRDKRPKDKNWINTEYALADFGDTDNVGINHQQSGTVSLDVDNHELARKIFKYVGIPTGDFSYRYTARPGRWKCLYRMPKNISSLTIRKLAAGQDHILEIRANGQDVMPGSTHPDGGVYEVKQEGFLPELASLPVIPDKLLDLYLNWDEWLPKILRDVFGLEAKTKGAGELVGNRKTLVDAFNEAHSLEQVLTANGYQGSSGRFLAPGSSTGQPGVIIYTEDGLEVAWSNHGAHDPLADGRLHDAFDCLRILEFDGDWDKALNTVSDQMHMPPSRLAAADFAEFGEEAPSPFEDAEDEPPPFTTWDDAHKFTPPKELVEGVLTFPSAAMFVAGYNVGKSALALDMAVSVAAGQDWHGRQVEQGGVLYMAVEGENSIKGRTLAYPNLKGIPFFIMGADKVDLSTSEGRSDTGRAVIKGCRSVDTKIRLVIVDTLAEAAPAIDENSLEFAQVAKWAKKIASKLKACVLVIHHRAKHSTGSRGHTSVPGAMDTILEIERDEETNICVGTWTKQRDLATRGQEIKYAIRSFDTGLINNFGNPVTVPRIDFNVEEDEAPQVDPVELNNRQRYQMLYLFNEGQGSERNLKHVLGVGRDTVVEIRDSLVRDGFLRRESERRWTVTEGGIAWLEARADDLLF